ncbi:MAG: response regulator [Chloroherpetonaceae bacterium]|nr:response regulator [Chloroherpetonaceae bacterium]MCS7210644.1 response regulator [Chloroherpetonaceae bacterium]MDW8018500.1 response regulator [Chloroherpetonaceae bacterium]MDW8466131.1 response regulator [Chloroherpetonaceae bacterium]
MSAPKKTLLVVDDEDLIRDLLADILSENYNLILCKDGAEGVKKFDEHFHHLSGVITDLVMPKLSGDRLIQHIRQKAPEMPILIITGYERETDLLSIQKSGNIKTLQKPFKIEKLHTTLQALLNPA